MRLAPLTVIALALAMIAIPPASATTLPPCEEVTEASTNVAGYYYFERGFVLGGTREVWEESNGLERLQRVDCVDAAGREWDADRLVHGATIAPPPGVPDVPCIRVIPNWAICVL